ncbi:SPOR domain-containing protein [Paludibacteraceae bacterium OttesenSCG-928-F17]|nr:SPOR domain-containing protein [Paludibacteraceae bacterium OttesenSCG-928-F17]
MKKQILLTIFSFFCVSMSFSQINPPPTPDPVPPVEYREEAPKNVFEIIANSDSVHEGVIRVYQDKRIEQLFMDRITLSNTGVASGFRVQVFSSNTQRTAKNEAFRIESLVREKLPNASIYVSYTSPFWKVRVGDFRTTEDAQILRNELMKAFPDMSKEMYIVKDEIIVSGSK